MFKSTICTNSALSNFLSKPDFKKYFTNTSWLMAEKIFRSAVSLVVGVYVARYLGPEGLGLLSYAMSFVALFVPIAMLGLDEIVIRELVKNETRKNELLGTAFFLKLTGAFFALAFLCITIYFTSNDALTNLLIFIIASSVILQSFNVIDFYFQSKVISRYVVYCQIASLVVSSLIKLFLVWTKAQLLYFAVVSLIESIILAAGLVIAYSGQKLSIFHWRPSPRLALALLRDSWPIVLSSFCVSIYMKIDQVMIKQLLDSEAVGQYAAAVRLSEISYFIPMVVCGSLFPAVLNAKNTSQEFYHTRLQNLYDLMMWMALPVMVVVTVLSDNIIRFLYGTAFDQAGPVLAIHIWASVFVFLGVASGKWYIAENLQFFSLINSAIGAIVNVVLNLILIRRYGIIGAAWATVISQGCASYLLNFVYTRTRSNFYRLSGAFNILRITKWVMQGMHKQKS
jgi:O-antigen/teichoic acid export membrane protein